jgi:hypothetical protein
MAVKVRNTQNGRVATVTDALGQALVKMGRHEYVVAEVVQEAEQEPAAEATEEPTQEKKRYRTRSMKAKD